MKKEPTKLKLIDLKLTNSKTGEEIVFKSDIYDIISRNEEVILVRNTETGEEILVLEEMVEEYLS